MTDKMHENWAKPTVPVWEEIKPPQVYGTAKELVHSLRHGYPSPLRIEAADVIDKQAAEIDALRKRVQELESAQQWRPIESAPKDGAEIILSNGETVAQGHWFHTPPFIREIRDMDGHYIDQDESDGYDDWIDSSGGMQPDPTHWIPLPQPPIEKGRLDVEGHPV